MKNCFKEKYEALLELENGASNKDVSFKYVVPKNTISTWKNAFNCMNRRVALHNVRITCPIVSIYLINTYRHPSRLFVSGGQEISSMEGTTQGDPLAMPWYSMNTVTIIQRLQNLDANVKQASRRCCRRRKNSITP